jgi:CBS domain-containing protein
VKVAEVMTRDVVTVAVTASVKEVAALLVEHGISGLPVVDSEGRVVGVVSEADILVKERAAPARSLLYVALHPAETIDEDLRRDARSAGEAMTRPALAIAPDRPLSEAAARMLDGDVNRLPVLEHGRLVGIVSRADLVRAFTRSDEEVAREIREEIVLRKLWIDPNRVTLTVRGGHVTLGGTLETKLGAELLPALVEQVPGVVSVVGQLGWQGEPR